MVVDPNLIARDRQPNLAAEVATFLVANAVQDCKVSNTLEPRPHDQERGAPGRPTGLDIGHGPAYHAEMVIFRVALLILAAIHALFIALTAAAGAFADGGAAWQRLVVVVLHPLGAAGVLLLVLRRRLTRTAISFIAALLLANLIADLAFAQMIAAGHMKGDWELAVMFAVVPAIGIGYALSLLRTGPRAHSCHQAPG